MGKGKFFLGAVFCALLLSCNDDMLSTPKSDGSDGKSNTASSISAPLDLSATNGGKRSVDLSWKSVNGAYRYLVFSAENPFSEYEQIWETGDTNWTAAISAGKTRYFKVLAVNYAGVKSPYSNVAVGSTLASPVITSIEMGSEGDKATVNWWMENCSDSTYANEIRYSIYVYDEKKTNVVKQVNIDSNVNQVEVSGLSARTKYYFSVEAYLISAQSSVESSGLIDAETARKLIPDAPAGLTASQGISETEINLQWTCPNDVDVASGSGTYEQKPVFFKIYRRKTAGEGETAAEWTEINSYVGGFEALSTVSWKDDAAETGLERGVKYDYKVQAFVDGVSKSISSESSASCETGWLVAVPEIKVNGEYTTEEENEDIYSKIAFSFEGEFENFGRNYSYVLRQSKFALSDTNCSSVVEKIDTTFADFETLLAAKIEFNNPAEQTGYYKWAVYILDEGTSDISQAVTSAVYDQSFIVTSDAKLVPNVTNFTVADGYSDHFEISFDYEEDYNYELCWIPEVDGIKQTRQSIALSEEAGLTVDDAGTTASFSHEAASGDCRNYILKAINQGISKEFEYGQLSQTLGTAEASSGTKSYSSIEINWEGVQKADFYSIEAYYTENPETLIYDSEDFAAGETGKSCSVTLGSVHGFDDASVSGKSITVKITSKNSKTGSTTTSTVETSLIGPALTEPAAGTYSADSISISWNKVEGAAGYVIGRGRCSDGTSGIVESSDSYFVSADGSSVKIEGDEVEGGRVSVTTGSNDRLVLKDVNVLSGESETSQISYKTNQAQISWGQEYQYVVIPVLNEKDFTFEVKNSALKETSKSKVQYTNLTSVSNGATGYGLNIKAAKAESDDTIKLTWKKPFKTNERSKSPSIFIRESGTTGSWKKAAATETLNSSSISAEFAPSDKTQAYDFVIVYNNGNAGITSVGAYENKLAALMDEDSKDEQQNKGYLLSLNGIEAGYVGGYTEQVSWTTYDFNNRKLGPDYYELQVFNSNLGASKGWTTIGKITPDVEASDYGNTVKVDDYAASAKIKAVNVGTASLQLEPVFDLIDGETVSDGSGTNTSGVLKVLRDPKHYYRLVAYRKVDEETTATASIGGDFSVYGYRNVTDEELAKAAMLALSYTFYLNDGGYADLSNVSSQFSYGGANTWTDSNGGTATFNSRSMWSGGKYKMFYTISGYAPEMLTPGGITASFIKISTKNEYGCAIKGLADNYIYMFRNYEDGGQYFDVETGDSKLSALSLSGTLCLENEYGTSSSSKMILKITRNGKTTTLCDTSSSGDIDLRKRWFPMQIHSETKYEIKSTGYGWWEE